MGKQLVKTGKSLKVKDACEDLLIMEKEDLVKTQKKGSRTQMLGTQRLASGKHSSNGKDSKSAKRYGNKDSVEERHHHKYEVNPDMVEGLEKAGLSLAAKDETGKRREQPVADLRTTRNKQEKCRDCKPNKSILARSTIPSKQEVKEDLVKTEKKESSFPDEAVKLEEAVKSKAALIKNMIIGGIIMLPYILKPISVSSVIAAKFSTNYSSSTPRQMSSNVSLSPVSPAKVQQVFVNFRGEQLRYNFVSHLSDAFQRHEIKFFIDKYEQRGKDLNHLFVRIEESSIALAIFSTRYPESSWCMDELVKMKKLEDQGKLRVIPIFYKVEAGDVRKPKRNSEFGKNFWRLAEDSSGDQIKEWKEALESISNKMGLSLEEKRSEADFVKEIVQELQRVI